MDQVLRLAAQRQATEPGVTALCAQLRCLRGATSPDRATMDLLAGTERRILAALAAARSDTPAEAAQKLAALARRAAPADGVLGVTGPALLPWAPDDLARLGPVTVAA
jgi:protein involved in temperature-dependent protein secretion